MFEVASELYKCMGCGWSPTSSDRIVASAEVVVHLAGVHHIPSDWLIQQGVIHEEPSALRRAFEAGWNSYIVQQTPSGDSQDVEDAWKEYIAKEEV